MVQVSLSKMKPAEPSKLKIDHGLTFCKNKYESKVCKVSPIIIYKKFWCIQIDVKGYARKLFGANLRV